ncbi:MAG: STAS domain-containing protein [Synergistaceae bacterium]|nr:STAS domain-containing protein [Synergistaceae bacterium]
MEKFSINTSKAGALKFSISGRLDAASSQNFLNVIMSHVGDKNDSTVIIDCRGLDYISSAGLRAMLAIHKKCNSQVVLTNVSPKIYEILEVTGFSQIFDVSVAEDNIKVSEVKELSQINGQLIGKSDGTEIFRVNSDELMKLYPAGKNLADVENEMKLTKAALLCGIPTLISYYIVHYNDRYGLVYEMPNARTVASLVNFQDWNLNQYAVNMGTALKQIHSCVPEEGIFPKTKSLVLEYLKHAASHYTKNEIEQLANLINAVPEKNTFVYGSYHAGNVFVQDDEIILLNMSGSSVGNPIFDLAEIYMIHVLESDIFAKSLTGFEPNRAKIFYDLMIRAYFDLNDIIEREYIIKIAALLDSALLPGMGNFTPVQINKFVTSARQNLFPKFTSYMNILSHAKF